MKERVFPFLLNVLMINIIICAQISVQTSEHQQKGQEKQCTPTLKVRRGTVSITTEMDAFQIKCPVRHCGLTLRVTWCKINKRSKCTPVNESDHIKIQREQQQGSGEEDFSYLQWTNISWKDSGLYRCEISGEMATRSHSINVTVLECRTEVTVPENRWWNAPVLSSLMLSCTIRYCRPCRVNVTWCKQQGESCIPLETGENRISVWHQLDPNTNIYFLIFLNVSLSDSGEYLCMVHQRDPCEGNTVFSPALRLDVTRNELGALDLAVNIGRILLFITATAAIILLTLCWTLKHKGKCCSRNVSSSSRRQEDSDLPTPPQPQQSDMENVTKDFQLSRLQKL